MSTTVAFRFPLGRYHATPWDRSVNEGASEWPPSPWRLLRALVATWYTRWPGLPAPVLDSLLDALGDPPSYWTPPARPGHTRHYLPDLEHRKGEPGRTDLTLDPFLSVGRRDELLVQWDTNLPEDRRAVLAKLAELIPYLGRADSVCEARLLDADPVPDESWWRPGASGTQHARLLAPTPPVSRSALEMTTVEVRKSRRTVPPGTAWVTYGASLLALTKRQPRRVSGPMVDAIRFFVAGSAPLRSANGILLADEVHRQVGARLSSKGVTESRRRQILGSKGADSDHQHAHWIPVADKARRGANVHALVLWTPGGIAPGEVAAIVPLLKVSGRRGAGDDGYDMHGLPALKLLFQAAGPIEQVAPELCAPSRGWVSLTPYLPVRHRKRESLDEYVTADVAAELGYRDRPMARITRVDTAGGLPDLWAREFRRYRLNERLARSRPGLGLRLQFDELVTGPLLLGQLSHFGYGIFVPETG